MKKLKTILIILVLTSMLFILAGCTTESSAEMKKRFKTVLYEGNYEVIYDKETKVQYLLIDVYYGDSVTILVDAEGKPLLYEEE